MLTEKEIQTVVDNVVSRLNRDEMSGTGSVSGDRPGVFEDMEKAIAAAGKAHRELMECSLDLRRQIIAAMREILRQNIPCLSEMAVEETGMGRVEDKRAKHKLTIDKTPGVEDLSTTAWSGDNGLTVVEQAPYGVIGAITVMLSRPLLPYALAFAAGAMIYVVIEELVPESQREAHSDVATVGALMGFAVMMTLDVALG